MSNFNLNRKEYIRINNNDGGSLTNFYKYVYYTSFVITGNSANPLPVTNNNAQVDLSNDDLFTNASLFCSENYPDGSRYACFVAQDDIVNFSTSVNVPYAKVNVYIGYEVSSSEPGVYFIEDQNGNYIITEDDINILIQ